eukprot:SAG11_NODE_16373_length_549_cov_1.017778_1_plen_37_part_10
MTLGATLGWDKFREQQFKYYGEGLPSPTAESIQFGAM